VKINCFIDHNYLTYRQQPYVSSRYKHQKLLVSVTMLLYAIRAILNSLPDYVGTIAAKRYRLYQKEEESKRRHSKWEQYVIAAILWLVKLITNSLEKFNMKSKRVVQKITVE
jgi:hypothetical protein